jgi:hypothetical protein
MYPLEEIELTFGVEFYDYENDPSELHNLAHDRPLASTRFELAQMLRECSDAARRPPALENATPGSH